MLVSVSPVYSKSQYIRRADNPPFQERTKHRPLPSNRVSVFSATVYLAFQYVIGITFFNLAYSNLAWAILYFIDSPLFILLSVYGPLWFNSCRCKQDLTSLARSYWDLYFVQIFDIPSSQTRHTLATGMARHCHEFWVCHRLDLVDEQRHGF